MAYKLPDLNGEKTGGLELLYADSTSSSWLTKAKVNDESSAIGRTVKQFFQAKKQKVPLSLVPYPNFDQSCVIIILEHNLTYSLILAQLK